ncbi:CMD domain protein [Bordetella genomosp. 10]|uniref:CMD domain protein n=1 Tax=Bordetella genomosp. 10 TaxID=1416804 RepID=A0A261SB84_9BORD|nr:CMD domain protein [Bordetella genomosp. 10]OZI34030.1 CMD domain protein [Bordetella genomosp. 10]
MTSTAIDTPDLIDRLAGVAAGSTLHALRRTRDKVADSTQGAFDAVFDPALPGLTLPERLAVATLAAQLTPSPAWAAYYADRLRQQDAALADALQGDAAPDPAGKPALSKRLRAILTFTQALIVKPVEAGKPALETLRAAGLDTPSVVTLAQLIAFLSYQLRVAATVAALGAAGAPAAGDGAASTGDSATTGAASTAGAASAASGSAASAAAAAAPRPADGPALHINGYTDRALTWHAWLDVVALEEASEEQLAVLKEAHPKALTSDYYLLLVHQPAVLRQRQIAFNAIMYAPGGLNRGERELAATAVSRVNGCVYCASVHAERFEQLAKRSDVIVDLFTDAAAPKATGRDRAIVDYATKLTLRPADVGAGDIQALRAAGFDELGILDLSHVIAVFAWANRLMLNLGAPDPVEPSA